MALIKCNECGEQVSTKAKACPKCGAPTQGKLATFTEAFLNLGLFTMLGIAFLIFMLWVGLFGGKPAENSTTNNAPLKKIQETPSVVLYPGPWKNEFSLPITKALSVNKIEKCGDYKYREHVNVRNKYLVHCTVDGKVWIEFIVATERYEVNGPFEPTPGL